MQKVQKTYTTEFKREAVRLAETSGKPITHIAVTRSIKWFFRRLADARGDEAVPQREHVGDPSRRRDFSNKNQSLTSL